MQGRVSDSDASKALQQEGVLHSDLIPGKYEGMKKEHTNRKLFD
jgi:hypothetical protein